MQQLQHKVNPQGEKCSIMQLLRQGGFGNTVVLKTIKSLSLILIIISIGIIICIGIGFFKVLCVTNITNVLGYASVLMVTANAILLYATLSYQNRIFKHERFEVTLFNLLENHRKIKNDIQIVVAEELSIEPDRYTGNDIFLFACAELRDIHSVLKGKSDVQNCLYINKRYGLDDAKIGEISERMKTGQKKAGPLFEVFYEIWRDYYEPIFRSLLLIVSHIANNNDIDLTDKNRYKDYLIAQMSQHEYTFMIFLYFYNLQFHKQLDNVCENNVFFNEPEESLFRRLIFK